MATLLSVLSALSQSAPLALTAAVTIRSEESMHHLLKRKDCWVHCFTCVSCNLLLAVPGPLRINTGCDLYCSLFYNTSSAGSAVYEPTIDTPSQHHGVGVCQLSPTNNHYNTAGWS